MVHTRTMRFFIFALFFCGFLSAPAAAADRWYGDAPAFAGETRDFSWRLSPGPPMTHEFARIGDADPVSLDAFKGKVVLLNFWATWCPPCVAEMPDLNALQEQRGGADFTVLALSLDTEGPDVVTDFLDRHGLTRLAPYLGNGRATFDHFRLAELPTTLLLGPDGAIWGAISGAADWDSGAALALIDHARALAAAN